MKCPKCGGTFGVRNSRHADSENHTLNAGLMKQAQEAVGWYCVDWVVRQRRCKSCAHTQVTFEVFSEDLEAMFATKSKKPPQE